MCQTPRQRVVEALAQTGAFLQHQPEVGRQRRKVRPRFRGQYAIRGSVAGTRRTRSSVSTRKHSYSAAACSAVSGGVSRVWVWPGVGRLAITSSALGYR